MAAAGNVANSFEWMFKVQDKMSGPLEAMGKAFASFDSKVDSAIGIFKTAINATSELTDVYLGLGINVIKGTKEFAQASRTMSTLEFKVGLDSEAAKELTNLTQQYGFAGKAMTEFAEATAYHAKSTGQSTQSIAELNFMLVKFGGLATSQLGRVGNSMTYLAQTTGISHDQMTTFTKSLESVFARMPGHSKEARERVTIDLQAIAAAFGSTFGDPALISDWVTKGLTPTGVEGKKIRGTIARFTNMTGDQIMEGFKNDPAEVLAIFAEGIYSIPEEQLKMMAPQIQDAMGMSFTRLKGMQ